LPVTRTASGQRADTSYPLRGYTAVQAWARAAEKAGSVEGADVAAALDTFVDEPLAIGPTTFTPELHIATTRPMAIIQSQEGQFSFVDRIMVREFELQ
jgi:branched-chain amino acid transport system substrate-binding protein